MRIQIPYRAPKLVITLFIAEFPFTVALLALFGIASPNLYRTKLWQDGADNGFNSSPSEILYAYANYRPISVPRVWGQFITNYNLVISVLSMFILLCKSVMYIVHCWPPILSCVIHALLTGLYLVSVVFQSSSDMSDPKHPQRGAPWYITKNCNVAAHPSNIGYCQQAKSAFACTICMTAIFVLHLFLSIISMIWSKKPSPEDEENDQSVERALKSPEFMVPPSSATVGSIRSPTTPRTLAFNKLGGTKDLPLRNHFSTPTPRSPTYANASLASPNREAQMYFPPPPKSAAK